ncbi:hypothetical protein O5O45_02380 [Hahella aquimaris]|uniref:hypothetical protein n=1 Tax=Hahella sp. HNIBRBA332 TaxID=3015983 RepID=UPI00273B7F9F|nr:hypothetical protein [Hahella sp. HNIBRBA332]WLQ14783.1 hypothetical protein O5O45_02380 [Hahella sp. HNIBRBA332]
MSVNPINEANNTFAFSIDMEGSAPVKGPKQEASLVLSDGKHDIPLMRFSRETYQPQLERPDGSAGTPGKQFDGKLSEASATLEVDIFAIMSLIHELAQTQKKGARDIRHGEYQQKWQSLENAGKELRDSAGKELAASLVQGAFQIAGGAASIKLTISSTKQTSALMKDTKLDPAQLQLKLQVPQNLTNLGQTYTQMAGGVGTVVAAPLTYESKLDQEQQKQHEAESEKHSANIDEAKDFIQTMKEIMDDVRAKLSAIEQSKHETRQKIFS